MATFILNDIKFIFIHISTCGGNILCHNLSDKHDQDLKNSFHTTNNPYFMRHPQLDSYYKKMSDKQLLPNHLFRRYFDECFIGNRQNFLFFTMVRNPWCQSLSFAKHLIIKYQLNIPFTLEYKKEINDIIHRIYPINHYTNDILSYQHYHFTTNIDGDMLDYDYILYFEDIKNDLKKLTELSGIEFDNNLHITHQKIDYRQYLTDETIELIAKCRAIDCELFGYDFDKGLIAKNNQPKIKKSVPTVSPATKKSQRKIRVKNNNNNAISVIM